MITNVNVLTNELMTTECNLVCSLEQENLQEYWHACLMN